MLYSLITYFPPCLVFCKKDTPGQPSGNNVSQISGSARVNGKQTKGKTSSSDNADTVRQYDYLKEYEALSRLSSGVPSQEGFVDANSEKELVCFAPLNNSVDSFFSLKYRWTPEFELLISMLLSILVSRVMNILSRRNSVKQ